MKNYEEMWKEALTADSPISISSTWTVFAESEVISLIASGKDRRRIAEKEGKKGGASL